MEIQGHTYIKVLVFNVTFNNISWRSVLVVVETGETLENHWVPCHERDSN